MLENEIISKVLGTIGLNKNAKIADALNTGWIIPSRTNSPPAEISP
jgi:hypothetical protein